MQERHSDRELYFQEQTFVTEKYILPYINKVFKTTGGMIVAEIGCGEGGNLKPFLDRGCEIIGIDIAANKIENAEKFYNSHPSKERTKFIAEDIYKINPNDIQKCDLIIMRDTIEHIPNQRVFLNKLKDFLKPEGRIFFSFPPWRMPFGGHQQICNSKIWSKLPYYHLLPMRMYKFVLKIFGETDAKITSLQEIKETGISIADFKRFLKQNKYKIEKEDYYLINPSYEVKFRVKAKKLPKIINIPYLRDFYTTAYYCVVKL